MSDIHLQILYIEEVKTIAQAQPFSYRLTLWSLFSAKRKWHNTM